MWWEPPKAQPLPLLRRRPGAGGGDSEKEEKTELEEDTTAARPWVSTAQGSGKFQVYPREEASGPKPRCPGEALGPGKPDFGNTWRSLLTVILADAVNHFAKDNFKVLTPDVYYTAKWA